MIPAVAVVGVGIHPFGRFDCDLPELGAIAARRACADAGISFADIDATIVANVGETMAAGQGVMARIAWTGRPIVNVESACASSAAALYLASGLIGSGQARTVLCVGVEKASRGFIPDCGYDRWQVDSGLGVNPAYFALQAADLLAETDCTVDDLADVSVKNHAYGALNPNAMYRKEMSRQQILDSTVVCPPLHLLMLCAPNEGAAAAVLTGAEGARNAIRPPVWLRGLSIVSKGPGDWFVPAPSRRSDDRRSLTARAAHQTYEQAGIGPDDVSVVECQDTDAASELLAYRDLGLCQPGGEADLLRSGATALGGARPVNPSGGLLSKGEPLGASGLGQLHELVTQLRGEAGARQAAGADVGLAHVMGAGHIASVALVSR